MPKIIERVTKRGNTVSSSYSITIPSVLIRSMGWKKGDEVIVGKLDGETLKIEKA